MANALFVELEATSRKYAVTEQATLDELANDANCCKEAKNGLN